MYVHVGALEGQTVYPPPTGYGLQQPPSHHHTNSDGQMNHPDGPTGYPPSLTGPSIYENWGPVKSTSVRHHSSSAVGETADNLRGINVSSPPPLPAKPVGSLASQEPTPTMPPFSTNATSQYQTSHQVCLLHVYLYCSQQYMHNIVEFYCYENLIKLH